MRIFTEKLNFILKETDYCLEQYIPLNEVLFVDIETTGFTANSSALYLIGCIYNKAGSFYLHQFFAEHLMDEKELLTEFMEFAKPYKMIIDYNGNRFDIPYLEQKCRSFGVPFPLTAMTGLDLFQRINPYKTFLRLPDCKQKTVEQFMGITREDLYNGGELINVYKTYLGKPTDEALQLLLLHNKEDMIGMLRILPMLAYYDLFNGKIRVKKVQANYFDEDTSSQRAELFMKLSLPANLPMPLKFKARGCSFEGELGSATLRVPMFIGELKYFYANYKDYYYLPGEDMAMHKSVAGYVDKERRVNATAATCYTRKYATFLPMWETLFTPFFKKEYSDKTYYFELTDSFKQDRDGFSAYASHILNIMRYEEGKQKDPEE
ncbi:MAG: ribonuclease H-like domain-containing protein [Lachnospiraceae bacterium]|nr:ribonuclease H-like domain-containing protein [Lachnospiraceae bacterium]